MQRSSTPGPVFVDSGANELEGDVNGGLPDLGPRYRVERELGRGAFGVVYLAFATELAVPCAVKLLHAEPGLDRKLESTLRREAAAALAVSSPHVAAWRDFGRSVDGRSFVAFEFCDGETLRQRLVRAPLPEAERFAILRQLAEGISAIHRAGIVHRDLKPGNVMLVPRNDGPPLVKILDFGLARLQPSEHGGGTVTTAGMCTPGYAPPEYVRLESRATAVAPSFDVFSLGAIAYELFAGRKPYPGRTTDEILLRVATEAPPRIDDGQGPAAPPLREVADLLVQALDPDPARRPRDLVAWVEAIAAAWEARQRLAREAQIDAVAEAGRAPGRHDGLAEALGDGAVSGTRRARARARMLATVLAVVLGPFLFVTLRDALRRGAGEAGGTRSADHGREAPPAAGEEVDRSSSAAPATPPTLPEWAEVLPGPPPAGVVLPEGTPARIRDRRTGILLLAVPAGEAWLGSDDALFPDEGPARRVRFPRVTWLAETETTVEQWERLMGRREGAVDAAARDAAVTDLSWHEAAAFVARAGAGFHLPSELVLEFATRAGREPAVLEAALPRESLPASRGNGRTEGRPHDVARDGAAGDVAGAASPGAGSGGDAVTALPANPWGFRGLVGGVWELSGTPYSATLYADLADGAADPPAVPPDHRLAQRGGSSAEPAARRTATARAAALPTAHDPTTGFRVAWRP